MNRRHAVDHRCAELSADEQKRVLLREFDDR
jgi:hypothetical protein